VTLAGYLGPPGTFSHEALARAAAGRALELVPLPTVQDAVLGVRDGELDRALVPIENSLEGAVTATLDTLALAAERVAILAELVHPISQCLIAREQLALEEIEVVVSHPQPSGQCRAWLRTHVPSATLAPASSTAEAVRVVAERGGRWAALGNRLAAELYGCRVLAADVQDEPDNDTRFVWLGPRATSAEAAGRARAPQGGDPRCEMGEGREQRVGLASTRFKTAIVFWGAGSEAPGWLVACLSELSRRGVNLTRIESRPRRRGLGQYMFFADLEGHVDEEPVAAGLAGLRSHVEVLRVLGSFPAAAGYEPVELP